MTHKKVRFNGKIYWLHEVRANQYNLSPLDHYAENGDLIANPLMDVSYAVILGDRIMRHGEYIGLMSDLQDVGEE